MKLTGKLNPVKECRYHLLAQAETVLAECTDRQPLTIRHMFCRLVGRHGCDKIEMAHRCTSEAMVKALCHALTLKLGGSEAYGAICTDDL